MSCFLGRMVEFPSVSIDRFDGANLKSDYFFLSHCHQDHMVGLNDQEAMIKCLKKRKINIYCHKITVSLLLSDPRYCYLEPYLIGLAVHDPIALDIADDGLGEPQTVTITLLPAGHCIGSVMILFESQRAVTLYTGDIRLSKSDLANMKEFLRPDMLDSLYIDTTFFTPAAFWFPSRSRVVTIVVSRTREWLAQSPRHKVLLHLTARYGHEFLIMKVSKELNVKIHITGQKIGTFGMIPVLRDCITHDPKQTRIHACSFWTEEDNDLYPDPANVNIITRPRANHSLCGDVNSLSWNVLTIKPTTMYFQLNNARVKNIVVQERRNLVRVCYSMHSSMSELNGILQYLRPKRAYCNVAPVGCTLAEVSANMDRTLAAITKRSSQNFCDGWKSGLLSRKRTSGGLRRVIARAYSLSSNSNPFTSTVLNSPTGSSFRNKRLKVCDRSMSLSLGLENVIDRSNSSIDQLFNNRRSCDNCSQIGKYIDANYEPSQSSNKERKFFASKRKRANSSSLKNPTNIHFRKIITNEPTLDLFGESLEFSDDVSTDKSFDNSMDNVTSCLIKDLQEGGGKIDKLLMEKCVNDVDPSLAIDLFDDYSRNENEFAVNKCEGDNHSERIFDDYSINESVMIANSLTCQSELVLPNELTTENSKIVDLKDDIVSVSNQPQHVYDQETMMIDSWSNVFEASEADVDNEITNRNLTNLHFAKDSVKGGCCDLTPLSNNELNMNNLFDDKNSAEPDPSPDLFDQTCDIGIGGIAAMIKQSSSGYPVRISSNMSEAPIGRVPAKEISPDLFEDSLTVVVCDADNCRIENRDNTLVDSIICDDRSVLWVDSDCDITSATKGWGVEKGGAGDNNILKSGGCDDLGVSSCDLNLMESNFNGEKSRKCNCANEVHCDAKPGCSAAMRKLTPSKRRGAEKIEAKFSETTPARFEDRLTGTNNNCFRRSVSGKNAQSHGIDLRKSSEFGMIDLDSNFNRVSSMPPSGSDIKQDRAKRELNAESCVIDLGSDSEIESADEREVVSLLREKSETLSSTEEVVESGLVVNDKAKSKNGLCVLKNKSESELPSEIEWLSKETAAKSPGKTNKNSKSRKFEKLRRNFLFKKF